MDDATIARRELLEQLRQLLKAARILKNPQQPTGTMSVLHAVDRLATGGGCHGKDLAGECALDPSTISRAVAALVKEGLVARTADPADGRASVLAPTPHGRRVLDNVTGWYDDRLADALRDWTTDDLHTFAAYLQRFAGSVLTNTDQSRPHTILEAAR